MSEDQLSFHRGYRNLEHYWQKTILWTHFVPEVTQERKLSLLIITQTEYDRLLDIALIEIARKVESIDAETAKKDAEALIKCETASKQTLQEPITPLWPSRIFSYVHKVAINDSRRNPFPICLDENGHSNPHSPFVSGPVDPNVYCKRPNDELFAVVPHWKWMRLRRQGQLDHYLADHRNGTNVITLFPNDVPPARPIRILRQRKSGQWLVGKESDLKHIRKSKGLEHIAIAWQSSEVDALKAIWGTWLFRGSKKAALDNVSGPTYLDNDAYLPAYTAEDSFDQKAMRGFTTHEEVKIIGIQSPKAQLEIDQKLAEFEEKISEAEKRGLTDLCGQHKKQMADFKRLITGSFISNKRSRPADEDDIFRPILHNLRERRASAFGLLRKAGLHDETDDLDNCYKIENRTVIFC